MAKKVSDEERYIMMTEAPVGRLISSLAVPCIISNLITTIYNMADTYFIGRISTSASGAVGIALSCMNLIQALGFFFGQGSGINISRLLGAHNKEEAGKIGSTAFFTCLMASVVFALTGRILLTPLCRLLGSTDTILPYARAYLGVILLGTPFMAGGHVLNQQLRQQGLSFYGMLGLGTGGVLNMILDPIFIFRLEMGIAGAALATIVSQMVSFTILLIGLERNAVVKIRLKDLAPSAARYKAIYRCGLPSMTRQAIGSFANAALNNAAGVYGDAAIAAMAIVTKIGNFTNACVLGYGQGFQPVCGYNYGAKKIDRVKESYKYCVRFGTVFLLVMCALEAVFAPTLIEIFRKGDPLVTAYGAAALRYHCVTFWLTAFAIMNNMLLQVIGKTYKSTLLGLVRQGLALIPCVIILPKFIGFLGVQTAQCFADVAGLIFGIIVIRGVWKELSGLEKEYQTSSGGEKA